MTATLHPLAPADLRARLAAGTAVLVDIREADEFARAHSAEPSHNRFRSGSRRT